MDVSSSKSDEFRTGINHIKLYIFVSSTAASLQESISSRKFQFHNTFVENIF